MSPSVNAVINKMNTVIQNFLALNIEDQSRPLVVLHMDQIWEKLISKILHFWDKIKIV